MDDKKRITLLRKGDEKALESIILTYTNYVGTVIANRLGGFSDTQVIEELTSDVFFSLWKNCRTLTGDNLKGWLAATARNKAKNYIRSKGIVFEELDDDVIVCSEDNTFDKLGNEEQSKVISEALGKLEPAEREVLIRYYYCDQSTKTIADETGINLETVKSRLKRGRKKLKDIFDEGGYFK